MHRRGTEVGSQHSLFVSVKCLLQSEKDNMSKETHNQNCYDAKVNEGRQMIRLQDTSVFPFSPKHPHEAQQHCHTTTCNILYVQVNMLKST